MSTIGAVLLAVGLFYFMVHRAGQQRLLAIRESETVTPGDLAEAAEYVTERLGEPGSFSRVTGVRGIIGAEQPLVSELSGQRCVYYSMQVSREYEEVPVRGDGRVGRPKRRSETVANNSQVIGFWVESDGARVRVNPETAQIEPVQVMDRFDYGYLQQGVRPTGVDTLGYHLRERACPVDREVYIFGEATDASGELVIQRPRDRRNSFIISMKSKDELLRAGREETTQQLHRALGFVGIGVFLMLIAF